MKRNNRDRLRLLSRQAIRISQLKFNAGFEITLGKFLSSDIICFVMYFNSSLFVRNKRPAFHLDDPLGFRC